MSEHSILPPSSAARRVACPGSREMESLYPREEGDAAKEGTAAHEEAAECLRTGKDSNNSYIQMYVDFVRHLMRSSKRTVGFDIEKKVDISYIHPQCWGTVDAIVVEPNRVHIIDFKYGFKHVDVFENWQLIEYSAGIPEVREVDYISFHIVQPRCFNGIPIDTWSIPLDCLMPYWAQLQRVEAVAMEPNAPQRVSSACYNCKARHACSTFQNAVLNQIDAMRYNLPNDLSNEELGQELRVLHHAQELIEARISGLEEEALCKLKAGERVPNYEIGQVQSRERWAKDSSEIDILASLFNVDLRKPPEFITPKQAIKAGIPAEVIREYSETPVGAYKLVATDPQKLRRIFNGK